MPNNRKALSSERSDMRMVFKYNYHIYVVVVLFIIERFKLVDCVVIKVLLSVMFVLCFVVIKGYLSVWFDVFCFSINVIHSINNSYFKVYAPV